MAKSDVARWPLFGWLAVAAGTIFVDRARRCDSTRVVIEIQRAIADRLLVIVFPEGTSSGGASVLPFRSALLESATRLECPITAAAVEYSLDSGSVSDEVCYWREMTFLPHLWNLCGKSGLVSTIRLSSVDRPARNRKRLAEQLHSLVCAIRVVRHAPFKRTIATPPSPFPGKEGRARRFRPQSSHRAREAAVAGSCKKSGQASGGEDRSQPLQGPLTLPEEISASDVAFGSRPNRRSHW